MCVFEIFCLTKRTSMLISNSYNTYIQLNVKTGAPKRVYGIYPTFSRIIVSMFFFVLPGPKIENIGTFVVSCSKYLLESRKCDSPLSDTTKEKKPKNVYEKKGGNNILFFAFRLKFAVLNLVFSTKIIVYVVLRLHSCSWTKKPYRYRK